VTDRPTVSCQVTLTGAIHASCHALNHCIQLSNFPQPFKEAKVKTVSKRYKDPKFPQNLVR